MEIRIGFDGYSQQAHRYNFLVNTGLLNIALIGQAKGKHILNENNNNNDMNHVSRVKSQFVKERKLSEKDMKNEVKLNKYIFEKSLLFFPSINREKGCGMNAPFIR